MLSHQWLCQCFVRGFVRRQAVMKMYAHSLTHSATHPAWTKKQCYRGCWSQEHHLTQRCLNNIIIINSVLHMKPYMHVWTNSCTLLQRRWCVRYHLQLEAFCLSQNIKFLLNANMCYIIRPYTHLSWLLLFLQCIMLLFVCRRQIVITSGSLGAFPKWKFHIEISFL